MDHKINALEQVRQDRQTRGLPCIDLVDADFHANGFVPPAEPFLAASQAYFAQRRYHPDPAGLPAARDSIVEFYRRGGPRSTPVANPASIDSSSLLITASSSEAYALLFATLCEPGDNVLIPLPAYPLFEDLLAHCHLSPRFYHLDPAHDWQPDLDLLDVLWDDKTALMVLVSPSNPCGSILSPQSLAGIAAIARRGGFGLIHDEVFSEFLYAGAVHHRALDHCPLVPVFTLNGISKLLASPDLKLGWILCSGPDAREHQELLTFRNDTFLSANSLSQFLLPSLLDSLRPWCRGMLDSLETNRQILATHLPASAPWRMHLPQGGIHGVLELDPEYFTDDESTCLALLRDHGLYLHPGYFYGIDDGPCLIMSLLKDPSRWPQLLDRLFSALAGLAARRQA